MDAEHLHARIPRLQIASGAGDRAARAEPGHEMRDLPVRLLPDLGPGGAEVRVGIRGIFVLVQLVPAGLARHLARLLHRPFRLTGHGAEVVGQLDQVRAERAQRGALLLGDRERERGREVEMPGVGEHREGHPGVARSRLDQAAAIADLELQPLLLRRTQEVRGDAIFHCAEGVVPLELRVDGRVLERAEAPDPNQRRGVLDAREELEDRVVDTFSVVGHEVSLAGCPRRVQVVNPVNMRRRMLAIQIEVLGHAGISLP